MGRISLAFKLFWKVLTDEEVAGRAGRVFDEKPVEPAPARTVTTVTPVAAAAPVRSEAVTLLAVLQREARLVDFLKEEIAGYADAQVGAAVRDVHRDAAAALERLFGLRPVAEGVEGAEVPIPAGVDAARLRLVGNVGGQAPARGRLQHAGWQATKAELPTFTGNAEAAKIVAPAEVEV